VRKLDDIYTKFSPPRAPTGLEYSHRLLWGIWLQEEIFSRVHTLKSHKKSFLFKNDDTPCQFFQIKTLYIKKIYLEEYNVQL